MFWDFGKASQDITRSFQRTFEKYWEYGWSSFSPLHTQHRRFAIMPAEENDFERLAELHGKGFSRGWTETEIATLAGKPTHSIHVARPVGRPGVPVAGFVIWSQTLDEAEILSITVDPAERGDGHGGELMREAIRQLQHDRVEKLFLEVDSANAPAVALYRKLGFETVGERPGYYAKRAGEADTEKATALVMRLTLV